MGPDVGPGASLGFAFVSSFTVCFDARSCSSTDQRSRRRMEALAVNLAFVVGHIKNLLFPQSEIN